MASRDVLMVGVILFMLAIGFFVIYNISFKVTEKMIGMSAINQSASAVKALEGSQKVMARMDYVIFGVFIGLILAIIITGWFIGGNPIFMSIYFLISIIGVVISTVFANTWETVSQASIFGTDVAAFPITNNIMLNLPIYLAVVAFLGLVVMFAKPYFMGGTSSDGGGSY